MALGKVFNTVDSWGLLTIRLGLGAIFFAHGAQKLFGWFGGAGLEVTLQNFQQGLGITAPWAFLAMVAEFFGALAVIVGLLTRLASLNLAIVMIVAIIKVHWGNGFFLNMTCQPGTGHGFEFNLALLAMSMALVLSGGGRLSIDRWISGL